MTAILPARPSEAAGRLVDPETVLDGAEPDAHTRIATSLRLRRREIVAVLDPVRARPEAGEVERSDQEVVEAAAERLTAYLGPGELVAATEDGKLRLRLRREDRAARPERLQAMAYHAVEVIEALDRRDDGRPVVLDLGVGWAPITRKQDAHQAERHAASAAAESVRQRDLQPRQEGRHLRARRPHVDRWSTGNQVLIATVGAVVVPYLVLVGFHALGLDLSSLLYWLVVGALGVTAAMIWAETSHALDPPRPSGTAGPTPRATAVIAAYLPNEEETILETLRHFLAQRAQGGLQVVLAYNTPFPLPVEAELQALAAEHPDLVVLKVPDSTSKAQNVNAALHVADGEVIGIFDADHHPMQGAFDRAWQWLGDPEEPADVVQGHCVIRNGEDSALARLVAVEFEQIYAVSHPGRATLHGFGIFGGSNGYWRASALERIRLRGSYLTEDIEASMRVLAAGGRIVNDPGLLSRELAPETPSALWKQRMRWAQGWFQVSLRHLGPILRSHELSLRQKAGATYLLAWREVYPWLSLMTWPLLGFLAWRDGGLDMGSPFFLLVTLFVTVSGPLQALAAWRLATPEIRRHRRWFVVAALVNLLVYTEAKNLVNRVAQLKQLRGEHQWVVTPRRADARPTVAQEVAA
jgi:cellulose synthase/poly-beta-1,6-N-acetylglucosamine synthase-like glycosyltransferase